MPFKYMKEQGELTVTYTDETLDSIYKEKEALKVKVDKEIDTLNSLIKELEEE